jgi:hypothetical protein
MLPIWESLSSVHLTFDSSTLPTTGYFAVQIDGHA